MKYTFLPTCTDLSVPIIRVVQGDADETVLLADGRREIRLSVPDKKKITRRSLVLLVRRAILAAKKLKARTVAVGATEFLFPHLALSGKELGRLVATEMDMANYDHVSYKSMPKEGWPFIEEVIITGKASVALKSGIDEGALLGAYVNGTRELANTPGGDMTPEKLAAEAERLAEGTKVSVKVLNVPAMEKLGMGAILGVGRGSDAEPRFIIMEYWGAGKTRGKRPVVLVGKGITFDTGGLNLKPSSGIYEMHMDMSGAAAVMNTIAFAARRGLKKNIIALIPAAENMPSGSSYHPGDVLRSMSGKTIEVLNTDAEGRVVLADALEYAKRYEPRLVVDVATLTGASIVALGSYASALFTTSDRLTERVERWGEESGDYVWPLPLWDEYERDIKGTFGDWANTGKPGKAGTQSGAIFLYQFTKGEDGKSAYPWVHIDIAPRMTAAEGDELAKGAAGAPVRLLAQLVEEY